MAVRHTSNEPPNSAVTFRFNFTFFGWLVGWLVAVRFTMPASNHETSKCLYNMKFPSILWWNSHSMMPIYHMALPAAVPWYRAGHGTAGADIHVQCTYDAFGVGAVHVWSPSPETWMCVIYTIILRAINMQPSGIQTHSSLIESFYHWKWMQPLNM